jgi:hypothetical protein
MRNNQIRLITLGLVAMFMSFSTSVLAYDASISVDATVVQSLQANVTTDLSFGSFGLVDNGSAGTVDTAGSNTNIDEIVAPTVGVVTIAGAASTAVNVSVTNATLSGAGDDMTATLSVSDTNPTLDGSGAATVNVNGSLAVAAGQAAGSYTGSATVTVNY